MTFSPEEIKDLKEKAKKIRWETLNMITGLGGSHIGPAFSIVELLLVLYEKILVYRANEPSYPDRDRFILSKGHACQAL